MARHRVASWGHKRRNWGKQMSNHHESERAVPRWLFRPMRLLVASVGAVALLFALSGPASAHGGPGGPPDPLADGLVGPLSIDVSARGDVLVGQSFAGLVTKVSKKGAVTDLLQEPNASAVAWGPFGIAMYTLSNPEEGVAQLKIRFPNGSTRVLADLRSYEESANPDAGGNYGAQGITDECAAEWPVDELGPAQYPGQIDSNPYALAVAPWGVYVADAGANAILLVDWFGRVSTAAVLPPQPLVIPDDPTGLGLPACVGGLTYNFEPVPTDIELSHSGAFVSLLPGGPEDPSLGARGSVVKVNLWNGSSRTVADGILGATDLAVTPRGDIYVTELFGGRVVKVTHSGLRTVSELPDPVAVEWNHGRLVVAYDAFGSGKLTSIRA